jgi:hypothetical protein
MTTTQVTMMVVQEKTRSYVKQTLSDDFIPFAIETYGCLHSCFDSLLTPCAQTFIAHHQRSSLIPSMLVAYYQQCMSITLQHAQAIMILQRAITLGEGSSFLPHIIADASTSLAYLWQMTTLSS